MKRLAALLLSALLFCALSIPVFAAEEELVTYEIEDWGIFIDLPASYGVFTREAKDTDPLFELYPVPHATISAVFEDPTIQLMSLSEDASSLLILSAQEAADTSANDDVLAAALTYAEQLFLDSGYTFLGTETQEFSGYPFICIYYKNPATGLYGAYMGTIRSNVNIGFALASPDGPLTASQFDLLFTIAESITVEDSSGPSLKGILLLSTCILTTVVIGIVVFSPKQRRKSVE